MPLLAPVQGEDAIGVSPNEVHRKLCCIDESEMLFLLFRIARGGIMEHVVALIRKQTKLNKNLMYNVFQIPDDPIVPLSKRGATTMMRMFSSGADIAAGKPRPRYLRSIPLNDPDFSRLYGLREDTESMHNDYKSRLVNRRAGSVGLARREMDIRGYQMFQMVVALMAWKIRTGGDVSEFLGQWEPPERARRRNDA